MSVGARVWLIGVAAACLAIRPVTAVGQELAGRMSLEATGWVQAPLYPGQQQLSSSLRLEPELAVDRGSQRLLFVPFVRWDQADAERTHWDVRELLWEYAADSWELGVGVGRVFWGVTESQHLVDVVNQTDFVENADGEDKLGQPMVHAGLFRDWGTLDVFVLPGFRTRTFPGTGGRPYFVFPLAIDRTVFESAAGRRHVDVAARWSLVAGAADIGVSHFHGTSREPRFVADSNDAGQLIFVPHYDLVDQTGLDLSWVSGAWLWKLEALNRHSDAERFAAVAGGLEYTWFDLLESGADLGLLAEYTWDERGPDGQNPFNDEVFVAARLALNDIPGSELLSGIAVDRRSGASVMTVEGSRRLGSRWRLTFEMRSFFAIPPTDFLYSFRADDHVRIEAEWFF